MEEIEDGQWLTLAELAAARHTSEASATRLVRRHEQWRRQRDGLSQLANWGQKPGRSRQGRRALIPRIDGSNSMIRGLSAPMLMELAYDLIAIGLHDLSQLCRAAAEGGKEGAADRTGASARDCHGVLLAPRAMAAAAAGWAEPSC